ncbi:MAG: hypothetical protein LJE84_11910 [Gammaproteobacteria bacterium]|nr:hypothetical protein [Gammaproteobacteria bacterium]
MNQTSQSRREMRIRQFVLLLLAALVLAGCGTTYPNRDPAGEKLLDFQGRSLAGQQWNLPANLSEPRSILLFGFKQNTQFDIDRWLIGLDQYQVKAPVFEIPAVQGFFPRLISGRIDSGMRNGIPDELWSIVITVYGDGDRVQKFFGNQNPNNARVVVIDGTGTILSFHDRGFSVAELKKLLGVL